MTANRSRTLAAALAAVSSVALIAACSPSSNTQTAGEKLDSAVAKVEQKAGELRSDVGAAGTTAGQAIGQTAEGVGDKVKDAAITTAVNAQLVADPALSALKINVDTVGGRVVLRGSAPSAESREQATGLASRVDGVLAVDNQLVVAAKS